jgi:hypothetical protein
MALAAIHARRAEHLDAEAHARDAVAISEQTDWLSMRGDAHMCLASTLAAAGRRDESGAAANTAAQLYEAKGNAVSAQRARASAGLTTGVAAVDHAP